jgi:hypothetical protein
MNDFDNQDNYSYRPPYNPEEGDTSPDEPRYTRPLSPDEQEPLPDSGPQQVNPDWRSRRKATGSRGARRTRRAPSASPQEMQIWLQQGGWMYVAGVAFIFVVALVIMLSLNNSNDTTATTNQTPLAATSASTSGDNGSEESSAPGVGDTLEPLPTVTPIPTTAAPTPMQTQAFIVSGTGNYGLFLRADHSPNATILETLRDGTRVEQIDEDFHGASYVWRKVRAPSGQEGWVAVDWLQEAVP